MTLPTSENMVIDFAQRITSRLPEGISLLKLQETESSFMVLQVIILNLYCSFMQLPNNKKIYFASDQHFGAPTPN
jgi:hypothetical protein